MLQDNEFEQAMMMDVQNIRSLYGNKYDGAICKAVDYARARGFF